MEKEEPVISDSEFIDDFKINFWNMKQATEMILVESLKIWVRASIMGANTLFSATRALEMLVIPYEDSEYRKTIAEIKNMMEIKKRQCYGRDNVVDNEKMEAAKYFYSFETFEAIWRLLFRHGLVPQKSEVTWSK